jgi:hypothetical protein
MIFNYRAPCKSLEICEASTARCQKAARFMVSQVAFAGMPLPPKNPIWLQAFPRCRYQFGHTSVDRRPILRLESLEIDPLAEVLPRMYGGRDGRR